MRIRTVLASLALLAGASATPIISADATDWSAQLGFEATMLTEPELGELRGAGLAPALAALLASLPPGNTVSVQIGNNPPEGSNGAGAQTITVTRGGATGSATASTGGPTSASAGVSSSCCAGFLRTRSFSRSSGFGARI